MSTCCITGVGREEWEGIFAVADDNDNLLCVYMAGLFGSTIMGGLHYRINIDFPFSL